MLPHSAYNFDVQQKALVPLLIVIALIIAGVGFFFWYTRQPGTNLLTRLTAPDQASPEQAFQTTYSSEAAIYQGTLPCADCEGIQTVLTLDPSPDGQPIDRIGSTYQLSMTYLGKDVSPVTTSGTWLLQNSQAYPQSTFNPSVDFIVLDHLSAENRTIYWLKDARTLVQLDADGNEIDAPGMNFTLTLMSQALPESSPFVLPDPETVSPLPSPVQ